jgi:hypothetical protein
MITFVSKGCTHAVGEAISNTRVTLERAARDASRARRSFRQAQVRLAPSVD